MGSRSRRTLVVVALATASCTTGASGPPEVTVPASMPVPSSSEPSPVTSSPTPSPSEPAQLPDSYLASTFRVVAVADSPFGMSTLTVAAQRSDIRCGNPKRPSKCGDDSSCGSIYQAETCYFFIEPGYVHGADPYPSLVGTWRSKRDQVDALLPRSLRFVEKQRVRFTSAGGDGGFGVKSTWELDLRTGAIDLIERHATNFGEPVD